MYIIKPDVNEEREHLHVDEESEVQEVDSSDKSQSEDSDSEEESDDDDLQVTSHCLCEKRLSALENSMRLLESRFDSPFFKKDEEIFSLNNEITSLSTQLRQAKTEMISALQAKDQAEIEVKELRLKLDSLSKDFTETKHELAESSKIINARDQEISNIGLKFHLLEQELIQTKSERDGFATTIRCLQQFPVNPTPAQILIQDDQALVNDNFICQFQSSQRKSTNRPSSRNLHTLSSTTKSNSTSNNTSNNNKSLSTNTSANNAGTNNNGKPLNENRSTVIVGDSMLKFIQGRKIGKKTKSKVYVKPYNGATIADMHYHVMPSIQRNPDQIIIHVGTNDIHTAEPHQIAEKIVDLARDIESKSENDVKVAISQLITRRGFEDKIKSANNHLKKIC